MAVVSTTEPLRIGILGAARIAERAIVSPAQAVGARLVAVAARDRSRAEAFAEQHGVHRVHDDYDGVLADPDVEVVYNPLANGLHGPWNLRALEAGKHVLSEKPFASNADEATEVAAAARGAGLVVSEAFHYRFHPVLLRLLDLVSSGVLGTLRDVEAVVNIPAPDDDDPRWSWSLAGGALMDLGCYGLHAHRVLGAWAGGEPWLVKASAGERAGHPGVDEWLDAELAFPSGATGLARCHMAADEQEMTLRVTGDRGSAAVASFVLPHLDDRITIATEDGTTVEETGRRSSYTFQLEALTSHLRSGDPLLLDADDAVTQMRLVDAAYTAAGLPTRPTYSG